MIDEQPESHRCEAVSSVQDGIKLIENNHLKPLHLIENILGVQHHKPDGQKLSEASNWFGREVGLNIKDFAVPTFHIKDVQFPTLGPITELEKDFLETVQPCHVPSPRDENKNLLGGRGG